MDSQTLDFDARYKVAGYRGVAFYLTGYATTEEHNVDMLNCTDSDCEHDDSCWAENTRPSPTPTWS